jgi:hypothetical protein
MGRQRRQNVGKSAKTVNNPAPGAKGASENRERARRIRELEDKLRAMGGGTDSWCLPDLPDLPPEVRENDLEDIIAFESIETGTSLFEGLQEHGLDLPHPDKLNERQCWEKTREVATALAHLRVFLVGFEDLSPQEFYRTLWEETLWEGCYVEKRNPGGITMIDVSHKMSPSDWEKYLEPMKRQSSVN